MDEIDLSAWVGKPPPMAKDPDAATPHTGQSEGNTSSGRKTDTRSTPPDIVSSRDMSASSRESSQPFDKPDTLSNPDPTHANNGFYIDIPVLSNTDEYEHLPGYFTIHKIVREVTPARYLVKLRSGEVDLVSVPS